jgi:ATP-dependent exoDNAse (exonuclease V) alpha subunit
LTNNVRKEDDFCNGMRCTAEYFDWKSRGLRVKTATGKRLMVFPWNNPHRKGSKAYYPIRPGYASTIMKFQGAGLEHATIWLDAPNIPGAAYTALSRVATRKDYLLGGYLRPGHFTPVTS